MAARKSFRDSSLSSGRSLSPELHNHSRNAASSKAMSQKKKPNHPSTADMVTAAIVHLAERGGSSLPAIKKYIANTYNLDVDKHATYIKKFLKSAVAKGSLVQITGRGASGSFKLPSAKQKAALAKAASGENTISAKKSLLLVNKKSSETTTSVKKQPPKKINKNGSSVKEKSRGNASRTATPAELKSPSKISKPVKSSTINPKSPKAKKTNISKSFKVVTAKKIAVSK